jgi:1-deoxy-D-xylulose-5-phosphate synthase
MQGETYPLLSQINTPADLRKLTVDQLPKVCEELRQFIIDELSHNPGHLGASLGTIEITVALHYVFSTPYDRIVWDVGHQAYGHKILTGRREEFHTNRQYKGLCGFPNPKESEYDSFIAGHTSNSISAALGMSVASLLSENDAKRQVVAVIGDGAMSGGLAFEGLNNASTNKNNLLIILNDNHMAIDPVKGGMSQYLLDITTSKTYNRIRYELYRALRKMGVMNEAKKNRIQRWTNSIKASISYQNNVFEGMNIRYFGPIDGHDVKDMVRIMQDIKDFTGPKVIHCITKKGKGYKPAEQAATEWHAPGKFDKETGERIVNNSVQTPPLFQEVFGETLLELARKNPAIVGITPAMPSGCSLNIMMNEMPDRCFDVGIAEGHAVTFAAGMAKEGKIPFCNVYSSFMQRAYDNIIHDIAILNLPVVLCLDRAGIVGADGATHHGAFDIAYLRCIPNMVIASPLNENELRNMLYTAQHEPKGVMAIRYPRGTGYQTDWKKEMKIVEIGTGRRLKEGKDLAILSFGPIGNAAQKAIEQYEKANDKTIAHYDMRFAKPLDEKLMHEIASSFKKIITIEDGVIKGGFGSAVLEFLADNGYSCQVKRLGLPDRFVEHGTPKELYHEIGLDMEGILNEIELGL